MQFSNVPDDDIEFKDLTVYFTNYKCYNDIFIENSIFIFACQMWQS